MSKDPNWLTKFLLTVEKHAKSNRKFRDDLKLIKYVF